MMFIAGHGAGCAMRSIRGGVAALLIATGLAACARQEARQTPPPPASTSALATIVSIRPAGPGSARGAILGALGGQPAGPAPASVSVSVSEFILRDSAGRTVSVVQANQDGLRQGERVLLVSGLRTRLLRVGTADLGTLPPG